MTKREATFINKSLSFLEQAVLSLSDRKSNYSHFRSSKLTHALKDSIGGRCNTAMIANIWPEVQHLEETVSDDNTPRTLQNTSAFRRSGLDASVRQSNDVCAG